MAFHTRIVRSKEPWKEPASETIVTVPICFTQRSYASGVDLGVDLACFLLNF
jgi:hypothetical protein